MPGAVIAARQSPRISLIDAAYAIPVGFVLGVLATGMARRAKRNLQWHRLDGRGTSVARIGVALGVLGLALAVTCAISVGVYKGVLYYEHHYR